MIKFSPDVLRGVRMLYKSILVAFLTAIAFALVRVVRTGRINAAGDSSMLQIHQHAAHLALIFLVAFVVLVEVGVRLKGGATFDKLFWIHILFAGPLLFTLIALNFWFNGIQSPYHAWIAYASIVLFVGTLTTGIPMIIFRL